MFLTQDQNQKIITFLQTKMKLRLLIVYGSYASGHATDESDIDLAIITKRKMNLNMQSFQKKLGRKIKIQELEKAKITREFLTTLANGIVLAGYLEL